MKQQLCVAFLPLPSENIFTLELVFFNFTNLIHVTIDLNGNIVIKNKFILETDDKRKRKKYVQKSRKIINSIYYSGEFFNYLKKLPKTIMLECPTLNRFLKNVVQYQNKKTIQNDIDYYVNKILKGNFFKINELNFNLKSRQSRYFSKCSDGEKFITSKRSLPFIYSDCLLFSSFVSNDH